MTGQTAQAHLLPVTRRRALKGLGLGLTGALLAACQPTPAPTPTAAPKSEPAQATKEPEPTKVPATAAPVVNIAYWHGWSVDTEKKTMEDGVKLFNEAHPTIRVEPISGKTNDQLLAAVAAGDPPGAAIIWSAQTLAQWAHTGVIQDLNDRVKASGLKEQDYYRAALDICRFGGKFYGLPVEIDTYMVYYNKDLFKAEGLDPEKTPKTAQELWEYAFKLTKVDDKGTITQIGFTGGNQMDEAMVYPYGGRYWDPATGQPTANDPANVAAYTDLLAYYKKFGAANISAFRAQKADNPLGDLFLVGKVAMEMGGDWITNYIPRFAPNMSWGLFPLPPAAGKEHLAYTAPIDGAIYIIPTGAKHPQESWEYVRWMAQSKEVSCVLQKGWANASPLKGVALDPNCLPNKEYQAFLDVMAKDKMVVWPTLPVSAFYNTERKAARDRIYYEKQTPQQALDELQKKVLDELSKAK